MSDSLLAGGSGSVQVTGLDSFYSFSSPLKTGTTFLPASIAALYSREKDGQGRYVDIAMVDCNFSLLSHMVARYADRRCVPVLSSLACAPLGLWPSGQRRSSH